MHKDYNFGTEQSINRQQIENIFVFIQYKTAKYKDEKLGNSCKNTSELGCPAKLISIRNNRKWNRNWFRNYTKQDVCFGCFGSISKQGVSVFRLNRNKKKTTETTEKSL
jgi:hypothetical protein